MKCKIENVKVVSRKGLFHAEVHVTRRFISGKGSFHAEVYFTQRARRSRESLTIGVFTQSRCLRQLRKGAKSAENQKKAQGRKENMEEKAHRIKVRKQKMENFKCSEGPSFTFKIFHFTLFLNPMPLQSAQHSGIRHSVLKYS